MALPITHRPLNPQHLANLIHKRVDNLRLRARLLRVQLNLAQLASAIPESLVEAGDFGEGFEDASVADVDYGPLFQVDGAGVISARAEDPSLALDGGCFCQWGVSLAYK